MFETPRMLELRGVSKSFDGVAALRRVSLKLERGQTGVLIGVSGSGKSSVLRLLIGLLEPDAGEVYFAGERVEPERVLALRRRMGYVIQDGGLFAHLNAYDNVALMPHHLRWAPERVRARIDELCTLVRLSPEVLRRYPAQLSGGERQRVSLMRALVLDPEALLLDEPLAALDPITRVELQRDLRSIFRALKKTVLFVTHDLREAEFFGDWVAVMCEGAIVQHGSYRDLVDRPADEFVRRFVAAQRDPIDRQEVSP